MQPNRFDPKSPDLAPAVVIGYFTDVESSTPGNTFGGASGYFIDVDHVVTARHLIEGIERDLANEWVGCNKYQQPYGLVVQDPRSQLSWHAFSYSPVGDTDLCVLMVVPNIFDAKSAEVYDEWSQSFESPRHRMTPIERGERITILGFTELDYRLEFDRTQSGGQRSLRIAPCGLRGSDTVKDIFHEGIRNMKFPCFTLGSLEAVGGMSGGPAVDERGRIAGVVSASFGGANLSTIVDWPATLQHLQRISPPKFLSFSCLSFGARFAPLRLED